MVRPCSFADVYNLDWIQGGIYQYVIDDPIMAGPLCLVIDTHRPAISFSRLGTHYNLWQVSLHLLRNSYLCQSVKRDREIPTVLMKTNLATGTICSVELISSLFIATTLASSSLEECPLHSRLCYSSYPAQSNLSFICSDQHTKMDK